MKTKIFFLAILLFAFSAVTNSQAQEKSDNNPKFLDDGHTHKQRSGLSGFLYFELMELEKTDPSLNSIPEDMKERYVFHEINSELYVGAFADIKPDKRDLAAEYGVLFNGKMDLPFMTVSIPLKKYVSFLNSGIADYIEVGEICKPMMDSARRVTQAYRVNSGYNLPKGYCGKGVVIGIIDIGFDYTHRNFYDSTETVYRVKRVWDQNNSGTPPSGYSYGNELTTQSAILAAQYSHNNQTHGTHVAGMAAGGGSSESAMRKYKGMAPESDIVLVATTMSSSDILDGLEYVLEYARSVGKPCVVNMSLGNHAGPHDGTDYNEQMTDALFENTYTKGAALMVSAGNEGNDPLHLSKTFTAQDSSLYTFVAKDDGSNNYSGTVWIWGTPGSNFRVKIHVVDSTSSISTLNSLSYSLVLPSSVDTYKYNDTLNNGGIIYLYDVESRNSNNNKPNIYFRFNGSNLSGAKCFLIKIEATSGTVHMWNNNGIFIGGTAATPGNSNYTSNNKASGNTSTMVASYNTKSNWTAYNGGGYYAPGLVVGDRSSFSSIGPGLNPNLNKPEIAAPGARILSSYNKYDGRYSTSNSSITHVQNPGGSWWGMMQGTSMACPAATGIVALWMEAYPELSWSQVKEVMRATAVTDSYTGTIPTNGSPSWGWGKIDAYRGIKYILSRIPKKPVLNPSSNTTICTGESITISAPTGYRHYQWNTGDTTRTITTSVAGSFSVRVDSVGGYFSPWSDTITISIGQPITTSISGNTTICAGNRTTLSVSGGTSHRWNTGATSSSITVNPSTTTTYTVVSSTPGHCDKIDTFTVTVKPYVSTTISRDTAICIGQSVTLRVSGGTSRTWSNSSTSTSITVTPSSTTTYTVTSNAANQCSKNDTVKVTVKPYVSTTISHDTSICPGESVSLTVSGGTSRTWSTNQTSATITVTPTTTTKYTVVSNATNQCSTTDSVKVTIKPIVSTTISPDTAICIGQSTTLTSSGGTSRIWSNSSTSSSITVTPSSTTTYYVVSDQAGYCSKTDSVTVIVKRYVTPTISNDTAICAGEQITISAGGGDSYYWTTNEQTPSITVQPRTSTTYMVTIDSTGLCRAYDSVNITVHPLPHLEITGDTGVVTNSSATLTVVGTGARTYLWSTGDTTATITVSPTVPTRYVVVGTSQYGCIDSAATTVVCSETSIANAEDIAFKLYPNPASTSITVESSAIETITIYNMLGKIVEKMTLNGKTKVEIPVGNFAQGVYVISLENKNGQFGRKTFVVR